MPLCDLNGATCVILMERLDLFGILAKVQDVRVWMAHKNKNKIFVYTPFVILLWNVGVVIYILLS